MDIVENETAKPRTPAEILSSIRACVYDAPPVPVDPVKVVVDIPKIVVENKQSTAKKTFDRKQFIADVVIAAQTNAIAYEQAMAQAGRPINQFYTDPTDQIEHYIENLVNQAIDLFDNYSGA